MTVLLIHDIIKTINFFIWGTPFVIKKDKLNKGNCVVPQSLKPKENRMKKVLLLAIVLAFLATPVYADALRTTAGVKVDAPNLVQITKNLSLGVEASKDIVYNIFRDKTYVEDDKGITGYVKLTYVGTLFDFSKK